MRVGRAGKVTIPSVVVSFIDQLQFAPINSSTTSLYCMQYVVFHGDQTLYYIPNSRYAHVARPYFWLSYQCADNNCFSLFFIGV